MNNLMELAMAVTAENVARKAKKESVNEALVRILYDGKQKLDRQTLIARISLDRLVAEMGEAEATKLATDDVAEFKARIKANNKTVKNGLDTSWSHSNNNSSFHYNEKYKHLELAEVNGKLQITKR